MEEEKIGDIMLLKVLSPVLVSYYDNVSKKYGRDLVDKLNIKTCPYCNRQFIYTFNGRAPERPELDHFIRKLIIHFSVCHSTILFQPVILATM